MGKYDPLRDYLKGLTADTVKLSFADVEGILGAQLPPSSHGSSIAWSNSYSHSKGAAWLDAGWLVDQVDMQAKAVVFRRATPAELAKYKPKGSRPVSPAALVVRAGPGGILADKFWTRSLVAVGWSKVGDLSTVRDGAQLRERIDQAYGFAPGTGSGRYYELEDFVLGLEPGVRVVAPDPAAREYLLGTVSTGYEYDADSDLRGTDEPYPHTVHVEWLGRAPRDALTDATRSLLDRRGFTVAWIDDAAVSDLWSAAGLSGGATRYWVEKTLVTGRPDRGRDQEDGLGRAVWSPKLGAAGADIYGAMREAKAADIVFHLVDNSAFVGVSVVASPAADFASPAGTDWGGRDGWRIALRDFVELDPVLGRGEFLNDDHKPALLAALDSGAKLFYNRGLNLNQGAYFTELPDALVGLLDATYLNNHGLHLPHVGGVAEPSRVDAHPTEEKSPSVNDIYSNLAQLRYHFPEWLVTDYVLSLATKPLAILSGISGTGKTQLAQRVASHVAPDVLVLEQLDEAPGEEPGSWIHVIGRNEHLHNSTPMPKRAHGLLERFPDSGESLNVDLVFEGQHHEARLSNYTYPGSAPLLEFWWKKSFANIIDRTMQEGDYLRFEPQYGEGALTIAVTLIRARREERKEHSPRIAFLSVRPDWTDNRGLLGYYNPLLQRYQATELLRLLLRAQANLGEAHFVVLDEMNLAKVEYYFSDFLSAMEADTEMILHDSDDELVLEGVESFVVPRRLRVPPNVFFTGTVNVDETTYMFSPKVLDRANTLEFNEVDLVRYGTGEGVATDSFRLNADASVERVLSAYHKPSPADWAELSQDYKTRLAALHSLLHEHNLHFGYRVANEIARYLNLTGEFVGEDALDTAFDLQVLQKVLPKFSGSRAKLERPLEELRTHLGAEGLLRSEVKVARMLETLRTVGFVSFVE